MSFTKQIFNNHVEFVEYIKSEAINQGWTLKKDGDDDGVASRRIIILRDPLDRFDACFMIALDVYNDYTYSGVINVQNCINYDITERFQSQNTGDDDLHQVAFKTNAPLNSIVSIDSLRIVACANQNGLVCNFYVGRYDSYKNAGLNNEDLITLSTKTPYSTGSPGVVNYSRNSNYFSAGSIYSNGAWVTCEFSFTDYTFIQPNEGFFTFYPMIVMSLLENRVFGELTGIYAIGQTGILPNSVFNFNAIDYHVFDSNETQPNYLLIKGE